MVDNKSKYLTHSTCFSANSVKKTKYSLSEYIVKPVIF